jgi:hypothetical protein
VLIFQTRRPRRSVILNSKQSLNVFAVIFYGLSNDIALNVANLRTPRSIPVREMAAGDGTVWSSPIDI